MVRAGAGPELSRVEPSGDNRVAQRYGRYRDLVQADLAAAPVSG